MHCCVWIPLWWIPPRPGLCRISHCLLYLSPIMQTMVEVDGPGTSWAGMTTTFTRVR